MANVLRECAARGEVAIVFVEKNVMDSHDPKNPTSLAIWSTPKPV